MRHVVWHGCERASIARLHSAHSSSQQQAHRKLSSEQKASVERLTRQTRVDHGAAELKAKGYASQSSWKPPSALEFAQWIAAPRKQDEDARHATEAALHASAHPGASVSSQASPRKLAERAAAAAAVAAAGATATTPAAQQKAAAEQAAADGKAVAEEVAAIRVQAIVRGHADRQAWAAVAATEVAAEAAAAAIAEARLLAREERRRASAAAAAAAAAATRAAIR